MKNIPVNRWTVGAILAVCVFFGSDFLAPFMKALAVMTNPYVPAI